MFDNVGHLYTMKTIDQVQKCGETANNKVRDSTEQTERCLFGQVKIH